MTDTAVLGIKVDSSPVRRAERDLERFQKTAGTTEKRTGTMAATMGKAFGRVTIAVAGLVAAAASVGGATRTLASFEKTMSGVAAVSGATGAELKALRQIAKDMGATTEFSASQAAEGLRFMSMAGFEARDSIAALPSVLNLATAASMDLGSAADIMSNIMSGFGVAASESAGAADILAAAAASANTDVRQLGDAMAYVGPVASGLGVDMAATAAAVGVLSDAGIQGSMAGTSLRRVLSSLTNVTGEAGKALAGMGLTLEDVNPATNELTEIIDKLSDAGITASEALTIFGDRGGPAILALTSQADGLRDLTGELRAADGAATSMANTMRDNLSGDIDTLRSSMEALIISMGEAGLTDVIRAVVQGVTWLVRQIDFVVSGLSVLKAAASDTFDTMRRGGALLVEAFGVVGDGIQGHMLSAFGGILASFDDMMVTITTRLNTIPGIELSYSGGGSEMRAKGDYLLRGASVNLQSLGSQFDALLNPDTSAIAEESMRNARIAAEDLAMSMEVVGQNAEEASRALGGGGAGGSGGGGGGLSDSVKEASADIQGSVNSMLEGMQREAEARIAPFKQAGQSLLNSLVDGLFSGNMNLGQSLGNIGKQLFSSSLQQIISPAGGGGIMAGIKGLFSGGLSGMLPGIGMAVGAIGGIFSRMSEANKEAAETIKRLEEADAQRAAEELEAFREKLAGVREATSAARLGVLRWTGATERSLDTFISAHGSLDALQANARFFSDTFETDAIRVKRASRQVNETFEDMGLRVVPKTREAFRDLVRELAQGGDRVGASRLISIARAFDDMVQGIEERVKRTRDTVLEVVREQMDAANAMVAARRQAAEDQLARVRVIFDAQADIAERAFARVRDSLTDMIDAASERARAAEDVLGVIQGGLRSRMGVGSLAMRRSRAMSVVNSGDLSDPRALDRAISTLNQPAQNLFRTQAEFQHDFAKTTAALRGLEDSAEDRLSAEERMVAALERQLETETREFERDNEQRAEMLRNLELQLEAADGLDLRLQSAIRAIYGTNAKANRVLTDNLSSLEIAQASAESAIRDLLDASGMRKAFTNQTSRLVENLGDGFNEQVQAIFGVQDQTFKVRSATEDVKKAVRRVESAIKKQKPGGGGGGSSSGLSDRDIKKIQQINNSAISFRKDALSSLPQVPKITKREARLGIGSDKPSYVYTSDGRRFSSLLGMPAQEVADAERKARAYIEKQQRRLENQEENIEDKLEQFRKRIRALGGIPSFASGGRHMGGLRLVGEEGPELEATGPSYIHSAGQTERILDNRAVVEELRQLRREVADMHREGMQVQTRTLYRSERQYHLARKWDTEGLPPERT